MPEDYDSKVLHMLYKWREEYSRMNLIPTNQILNEAQLKTIASIRPTTPHDFKKLGFDKVRTDLFEEPLLLLIEQAKSDTKIAKRASAPVNVDAYDTLEHDEFNAGDTLQGLAE